MDFVQHAGQPEVILWREVLAGAIKDLQSSDEPTRRQAWAWINSGDDSVGSFLFCCETFDVCPEVLRRRIRQTQGGG